MQSLGHQIGTKMRTLALHGKPTIEIDFDSSHGVHGKWVTSYSTMDSIKGSVCVTAPHDTAFEDIEISFTGQYRFQQQLPAVFLELELIQHIQAPAMYLSTGSPLHLPCQVAPKPLIAS